ncbi:MAG: hypothetical protein OEW75_00425 [Cyclobacteriaceae bacterium]|nr:hypothetical protein [Cyclobacteriaceae bacterium]
MKNKLNTFQDQEKIEDLDLGWVQFKWRNHMPEIGRFFNVDPLAEKYVYNSPYAFSENRVIDGRELEGLEWVNSTGQKVYDPSLNDGKGGYTEHASNNDRTLGAALNRHEIQHGTEENANINTNQGKNAVEDRADEVSQDILEEEQNKNR